MSPFRDPRDQAATPLDPDERAGLRLVHITTREELNAAEQANILEGQSWALARRRVVLDEGFLRELHRRMFGEVWRWAGIYRRSDKNVGVDWTRITEEVARLIQDASFWIEHESFEADKIAVRFHHRMTWIHCFANGNGRHARLATDLLLAGMGRPSFTWGRESLVDPTATRRQYVRALRAADHHDFAPLVQFVRT